MVHGGCWQKSIADRTLMNWAAEDLRKQGLPCGTSNIVASMKTAAAIPAHSSMWLMPQMRCAIRPRTYNLDLNRVAAFGHSAGGHLALWIGRASQAACQQSHAHGQSAQACGVVNSGGLADLKASRGVTQRDCLADIYDQLVGDISSTRAEVLSDTSPAEMLPLKVRQVSVNGHDDNIAPPVLGEGYTRRAKAAGDNADVVVVLNTGHVELISPAAKRGTSRRQPCGICSA
jgi:acetyl esterase/lipase